MSKMNFYFGYGANQSAEMMEAITGNSLDGESAMLHDYELVVQHQHEMEPKVVEILGLLRSPEEVEQFRTYAARQKRGAKVPGMAWRLSSLDRELVDNWEMNDGLWYQKKELSIVIGGKIVKATTEVMENPKLLPAKIIEPDLPVFLNPKNRMLEVASQVREKYLAERVA